jgi:hypothetical protein
MIAKLTHTHPRVVDCGHIKLANTLFPLYLYLYNKEN